MENVCQEPLGRQTLFHFDVQEEREVDTVSLATVIEEHFKKLPANLSSLPIGQN